MRLARTLIGYALGLGAFILFFGQGFVEDSWMTAVNTWPAPGRLTPHDMHGGTWFVTAEEIALLDRMQWGSLILFVGALLISPWSRPRNSTSREI